MNANDIIAYLTEKGYRATLENGGNTLSVTVKAGKQHLTLEHVFPTTIEHLPAFYLRDPPPLGSLAHVVPDSTTGLGIICVADRDSVSVNYDVPRKVYAESIGRHEALLQRLFENPEWNRSELLREFHSNWEFLCAAVGTIKPYLYSFGDDPGASLQVKLPRGKSVVGLTGHYLALPQELATNREFETVRSAVSWPRRQSVGKAIALRVNKTEPAPGSHEGVASWYLQALDGLDSSSRDALDRFRKHPGKEFWLLFSVDGGNGAASVALQFRNKRKAKLPITEADLAGWTVYPRTVRSLTRESLVPRGGASLELQDRSVLLVGCGSVGSEIAHRLAASGIGALTIADPDLFSEDNLYRHTLNITDVGYTKSSALSLDLHLKTPWTTVESWTRRLEKLRDRQVLEKFDLVVIAIGSPTIERSFHDFAQEASLQVPVVNVWVEAYGIGGHAILDVPGSPGCLNCAYVDPDNLRRGLSSNLNFLSPNQDVTRAYGGCGNLYLPYSGIAAGYSAIIAADFAIKYLSGDLLQSSRISWKGSSSEAERNGLAVTHRYHHFSQPMEALPLLNEHCDVCTR